LTLVTKTAIFDLSTFNTSEMSQKERDEFAKQAIAHRKTVTASARASKKFLVAVGVLTSKGNLRKFPKPACIPHAQG
jgi:hypothetical protein